LAVLLLLILSSVAVGNDSPGIVMFWPSQDKPSMKVTFGTFRQLASYAGKRTLVADVIVENVSGQPMLHASCTVYLLGPCTIGA
jgi:hypothetical protein